MKEDSIPVLTQILAIPTPPKQAKADDSTTHTGHAVQNASLQSTSETPVQQTSTKSETISRYSPTQLFSRLGNFGGLAHSMPQTLPPSAPITAKALPIEALTDDPILIHPAMPLPTSAESALSGIPIAPITPIAPIAPIAPITTATPAIRPALDASEIEALCQNACTQITAQLTQELSTHLEQYLMQKFEQALPQLLVDLQQQVHQNLSREMAVKIPLIIAQALSHRIDPPSNQ